jgi:TIR domain-containing protein
VLNTRRNQDSHKALHRCDWFLVALTESAIASTWVQRELEYAVADERFKDRIVPMRLDDTKPQKWNEFQFILATFQQIDFRDFDSGCGELLRAWGLEYRKPGSG